MLGSLSGLASQLTARQGNILGILGVGSGVLASLAAVGFPPDVLIQFAGVASIGSIIGEKFCQIRILLEGIINALDF
jgi:H+-translocating NAD(P) transhydrogenase